jgi:hypothetical protein
VNIKIPFKDLESNEDMIIRQLNDKFPEGPNVFQNLKKKIVP